MGRWEATFDYGSATGDWNAMRALCAPGMVFDDRRRLALLSGDCELLIASARERLAIGARPLSRLVGVAGDRVILQNMLWSGGPPDGRFEIEYLAVQEADEAGSLAAIVLFDIDDWRDAQREFWKRWSTIDPSVVSITRAVDRVMDAWNGRDRDLLLAVLAENVVVNDHRHSGIGHVEGAEAYAETVDVLWRLVPETRSEGGNVWLASAADRGVLYTRRIGIVAAAGGEYESEYFTLVLLDGERIRRLEIFEIDDADAAIARFDELRADLRA